MLSTTDSIFSIKSFRYGSSLSTPSDDFGESSNQWRIRPQNFPPSSTRAPRKPRYRSQAKDFQFKFYEDRDQDTRQDDVTNDERDNHSDGQDEVELKIPGAFPTWPEENLFHGNRNLEVHQAVNLTPVQYTILPAVEPQRPEFNSYGSSHKSIREINHSIQSLLQKPLKPLCDLAPGYIYAFESPDYAPFHIKIGQSSRAPEVRMREWSKCGIPIFEVRESTSYTTSRSTNGSGKDGFYHYGLVESIIFEEFHNQRKWFECRICKNSQRGNKRHIEWLEIDASTATHAINRWRTWLEREKPFTSSGRHKAYWQWRINELPKKSSNINWDDWTRPGMWEYWAFQLEQLSIYTSKLKPYIMRKDKQFWTTGCFFVFVSYLLYPFGFTLAFAIVLLAL